MAEVLDKRSMADNRRGKEKRFYFSRGQLILLGAGFIAAAVVIFFMGVFVGQGIEGRKLVKPEEPLIRVPVAPPTKGSDAAAPAKEELTFYDTLTQPPVAGTATTEGEKVIAETQKAAQRTEPRKKQEPATVAVDKAADRVEPAKRPKLAESAAAGETDKSWTVQVNAFPDPKSAQMWVDKLKSKGYNAYSAEVVNKGKTWYRVRVGQFASRDEAERLEQTLKTKENFPKAFVTSR